MEKIKVLQVKGVLSSDGATAILLNLAKELQNCVQFDFLLYEEEGNDYAYKFKAIGCHIFYLPIKGGNALGREIRRIIEYTDFFKEHSYEIVHVHSDNMKKVDMLFCAWRGGVACRIFHSHNAYSEDMKVLLRIPPIRGALKWLIFILSTDQLACSSMAAKWMFPIPVQSHVKIIKDGISIDNYKFNLKIREQIRHYYNLENSFVVGCVGRFVEQKNHAFLIDIFSQICNMVDNAKLLLIGDGELKDAIKEKICQIDLEDKVLFIGTTDKVSDYLNAMDIFILPSKFEGLGIAFIEAQANGLYCLASDVVPKETQVSDNLEFISLNREAEFWARKAIENKSNISQDVRLNAWEKVEEAGYDIKQSAYNLLKVYQKDR